MESQILEAVERIRRNLRRVIGNNTMKKAVQKELALISSLCEKPGKRKLPRKTLRIHETESLEPWESPKPEEPDLL